MYINKVQLLGNLTRDPEIITTNGGKMARIGIAVNRRYRHNGEMREEVQFLNVACFNERLVKVFEDHCHKGTQVFIEAELRNNEWTDNDGNKRQTLEIVMAPFRSELQLGARPQNRSSSNSSTGTSNDRQNDPASTAPANQQSEPSNENGGSSDGNHEDLEDLDVPF